MGSKHDKQWRRKTASYQTGKVLTKTPPAPDRNVSKVASAIEGEACFRAAALIMEEIEGCEMSPSDPLTIALRSLAERLRAGFYSAAPASVKPPWLE